MENQINRKVKVAELQKGDEVIVTGLRYLKLLRKPQTRKTPTTVYGSGGYKSIKCLDMSTTMLERQWGTEREVYYDFNYNDIWLVKRETEEL